MPFKDLEQVSVLFPFNVTSFEYAKNNLSIPFLFSGYLNKLSAVLKVSKITSVLIIIAKGTLFRGNKTILKKY